jgi:hypothetical protein
LTLATSKDVIKAIGLALSLRVSNPGVPTAVTCSIELASVLKNFFDYIIPEDPEIRGFRHKLELDRYSPFDETFFFDADVLVFRSLLPILPAWRAHAYAACGETIADGISPFGLDRKKVLVKIKRSSLIHIDGAGHAYFRKPDCTATFELAREIADNYEAFAGKIKLADEDVMDIALSILNAEPMARHGFWSRYCTGRRGTARMDASAGVCEFTDAATGEEVRPYMMHFAACEAPLAYYFQLRRLFRKNGIDVSPLRQVVSADAHFRYFRLPVNRIANKIRKITSRS